MSFISYSILLNEISFDNIILRRWLKQDNLIFSYLFITEVATLSRLLIHAKNINNLYCKKIAWNSLAISHLIYRDDLILFLERKSNWD